MNCAVHNQVAAIAYCRTCGKPLCEQCKRDVRGVIYCEDCLASRLALPPGVASAPAPGASQASSGGSNPVAATLLGFIPGVGAIYNGQILKAFIHVLIFAGLIAMAQHADILGLLVAFFYFYMVWDAYATAKAIQEKRPLPDPFGLGLTSAEPTPTSAPAPTSGSETGSGPSPAAATSHPHIPTSAIVLIGLGVLFLLSNMGLFRWHWMGHMWPVILIVIGVWLFLKRSGRAI
jgi:TM2 domain-containing membrane protein YozV